MTQPAAERISVEHKGAVAVVTFARPPLNFASVELIRDLADALERLDGDARCRAVVLQAEGKVFCAGADLANPEGVGGAGMDSIRALYDQALRIFACETPMVAAVQGAAVGAGLGLALTADFRVAAPEARFSANFVKLGFHPGFGLTHTLPRLVGAQRASLIMQTGRRIKPDEALAWGLVDAVAPAAELSAAALRLAEEIAENAPLAVVATRKTLRAGLAEGIREAMAHEHAQQGLLRDTEDYAEGLRAVAERRPGAFTGR
jgi:enoyl-CoA hydratase/carnithine racemase